LADRLIQLGQKKAVIFYNPASPFTHSLREDLRQSFTLKGGTILKEFTNLSDPNFDAEKAIQAIEKMGETAIILAPDGGVTNSQENAVKMIAANQNRNWIAATWGLYTEETLQAAAKLPSFEKLFIPATWHPLTSPDPEFPKLSERLWGGGINVRTVLAYDAARALIKAIALQCKINPLAKGCTPSFPILLLKLRVQLELSSLMNMAIGSIYPVNWFISYPVPNPYLVLRLSLFNLLQPTQQA
jgi:branched-chain amino acid transport system substrate-binding protein